MSKYVIFSTIISLFFVINIAAAQEESVAHAAPTDVSGHVDPVQIQQAHEIMGILNEVRAQMGLQPVSFNAHLTYAAAGHVNDMAVHNYFSHTSLDGRRASDRIRATGYRYVWYGENLLQQWSIDSFAAFNNLWASPDHQAMMIDGRYNEFGLAFAVSDTGAVFYGMILGTRT